MSYSYATQRKIRIIEEKMGPEWKARSGDKSIDAIYNELVGDTRKNLFCKIDAGVKSHLDDMTKAHKSGMAEFIEQLIETEWSRYQDRELAGQRAILDEFSG